MRQRAEAISALQRTDQHLRSTGDVPPRHLCGAQAVERCRNARSAHFGIDIGIAQFQRQMVGQVKAGIGLNPFGNDGVQILPLAVGAACRDKSDTRKIARPLPQRDIGDGVGHCSLHRADLDEAAALLQETVRIEPTNASAWRALGIVEGRRGREGLSALALAEQAVLVNNRKDAEFYLRRAEQIVQPNDPAWLQLQDVSRAVGDMQEPLRRRP